MQKLEILGDDFCVHAKRPRQICHRSRKIFVFFVFFVVKKFDHERHERHEQGIPAFAGMTKFS
ncbi:MAG: hypothetical protein LBE35_03930 [Clostridiales bacterium]|nr:hypothetical protein [Clostridiales bacterium]